jgi:hypothetical protein
MADLPKYLAGIQRTGFVLENAVATEFKRKGWTVISNKYYLDDVEEKAREIDLLVYRCTSVGNALKDLYRFTGKWKFTDDSEYELIEPPEVREGPDDSRATFNPFR